MNTLFLLAGAFACVIAALFFLVSAVKEIPVHEPNVGDER